MPLIWIYSQPPYLSSQYVEGHRQSTQSYPALMIFFQKVHLVEVRILGGGKLTLMLHRMFGIWLKNRLFLLKLRLLMAV